MSKRIAIALAMFFVMALPVYGAEYVPGDADGNGKIDIFDALFVVEYDADHTKPVPTNFSLAADVDWDGDSDIDDALRIAKYDAKLISELITGFEIRGYVKDVPEAEVSLYLSDGMTKIGSAQTDTDGFYYIRISEEKHEQIPDGENLQLVAKKGEKQLRGLILTYFPSEDHTYSGDDTFVSHYSEAVFRIAKAFSLDLNATTELYRLFAMPYIEGAFDQTHRRAQEYPFHGIIEDVAQNIRDNFENNTDLLSDEEIQEQVASLNDITPSDFNESSFRYAFPVVFENESGTVLMTLSFDIYTSELGDIGTFAVSGEYVHITDSAFYDEANVFSFQISNPDVVLSEVSVTTFENSGDATFVKEDYLDNLQNEDTHTVIQGSNIEIVLDPFETGKRSSPVSFGGIYFSDGQLKSKIYIDGSKIDPDKTGGKLYAQYFLGNGKKKIYKSGSVALESLSKDGPYYVMSHDLTDKLTEEDKHKAIFIMLREYILSYDVPLGYFYDFADWGNDYANASVSQLLMAGTRYGRYIGEPPANYDNEFINKSGQESLHYGNMPTHRIIDFDKIVDKDIVYNKDDKKFYWKESNYAKTGKAKFEDDDERTPILLIHGWQGDKGQETPSLLLDPANTELEYWHNFISFYLNQTELQEKFKLYLYHYPSYKHVTFNARMLNMMLDDLKDDNDTLLGKALTSDGYGIVILAHSMGGLISRSLIEEHKGLGENAEKLIRLITLDTPHHGSPSSMKLNWPAELASVFSKNCNTAGAADLFWDNYDEKYPYGKGTLGGYKEIIKERNQSLNRPDDLAKNFDDYYFKKIFVQNEDYRLNPFLTYLNQDFQSRSNTFAHRKYIFYVAHQVPNDITDSKTDPIAESPYGQTLNTQYLNAIGYGAGGAEPVCSAFLSNCWELGDECPTFLPGLYTTPYLPSKYIIIDNNGDSTNHNIPFRYFFDYTHDLILNGAYNEIGEWDILIDGSKDWGCSDNITAFKDIDDSLWGGCKTMRSEYISSALGIGSSFDEAEPLYDENGLNPLSYEPVFLVIKSDLLDNKYIKGHIIYDSESLKVGEPVEFQAEITETNMGDESSLLESTEWEIYLVEDGEKGDTPITTSEEPGEIYTYTFEQAGTYCIQATINGHVLEELNVTLFDIVVPTEEPIIVDAENPVAELSFTVSGKASVGADIAFVVDQSGTYRDDIVTFKNKATELVNSFSEFGESVQFGLSGFTDFPISPFGYSDSFPYKLHHELTEDSDTFVEAIASLGIGNGGDYPESQLEAIFLTAEEYKWRVGSLRIIFLATDDSFHDSDSDPDYPGHGYTETLEFLKSKNIVVFGLASGNAVSDLTRLAEDTGGQSYNLSSDSEEIIEKIQESMGEVSSTGYLLLEANIPNYVDRIEPASIDISGIAPGEQVKFTVHFNKDVIGVIDQSVTFSLILVTDRKTVLEVQPVILQP